MMRNSLRALSTTLGTLALAGCIASERPLLTDAKPMFGPELRLQLYSLRKGMAHEPERADFRWNGTAYARTGGNLRDVIAFTAHPFEGSDVIIQSNPGKRLRVAEYALARKLTDGVYLVIALDEADTDEATRTVACRKGDGVSCMIETREHLLAFARATAAKQTDSGGLVIRLPDRARAR